MRIFGKERLKPALELLGPDADMVTVFRNSCIGVLNVAENPCSEEFCKIDNMIHDMLSAYHDLKAKLLSAGGTGNIPSQKWLNNLNFSQKYDVLQDKQPKAQYTLQP